MRPFLLYLVVVSVPCLGMSLTIRPSVVPPAATGTVITWQASVNDSESGEIWFRYRVRTPDSTAFRTVRDFAPKSTIDWVPFDGEGAYEIEVTARDRTTGETVSSTAVYDVLPVATGTEPVITGTRRQQVVLYSAPSCARGQWFRVAFEPADGGTRQFTTWLACNAKQTMNTWLAGLRGNTEYRAWHLVAAPGGEPVQGPPLTFRTGDPDVEVAATRTLQKPDGQLRHGVLLQSTIFQFNVATDMDGNVIWSYPEPVQYFTRPELGGYFFALIENPRGSDTDQILRQIDLVGNTLLETNAGRVNEQLAERGMAPITSFHHEARRLPNGRILVLAGTERMIRDMQGPGDVDVIGDTILVLDRDLQLEWAWDAFDHLDVRRRAILDEKCRVGIGGCPVFRLAPEANDWLHGNSLQLTPDGHILYSARHQDWVIKIDYANGLGSGGVIWRLGPGGDFQMLSGEREPWFSHQHDANFERGPGSQGRMLVFDNGNTRYETDKSVHSRGQVLQIDEESRTASLVLNIDLGAYSMALGSAQRLSNGNYHFDLGWMPNGFSQSLEYTAEGELVTQIETETQQYRSFRMRDLYTP